MSERGWTEGLTPEEVDQIGRFEATLGDESTWTDPPEGLRDRIIAQAEALRGESEPAAIPIRTARSLGWAAVLTVAAIVALVLFLPRSDPPDRFVVAGTELAPTAEAVAEVTSLPAGVAIRLEITGLPPAEPGTYYSAWLVGPDGIVPAGSFHWREGGVPVGLWTGVEPVEYPEFLITVQDENADPTPTGQVVMRGSFD